MAGKESKKDNVGNVVYLGPSVYGVVQKNTAYQNGFPPKLEALLRSRPVLKELFVPVSQLAAAKRELQMEGSRLKTLYLAAVKELEEHGGDGNV